MPDTSSLCARAQPRSRSWGSNFLVRGITALLQKKNLERYPQFGAVRYQHQTPTKKLRKSWGVRRNFFLFSGGRVRVLCSSNIATK